MNKKTKPTPPPARTYEERLLQISAKALDEVERRIDNGTASSQILTTYSKMASKAERLEAEKKEVEIELARAKVDAMRALESQRELYENAILAMKRYKGISDDE